MSGENQLYALKRVKLSGVDKTTVDGYLNEIDLLKRLRKDPRIIQLVDSEITRNSIVMVLEFGEIDLAHLLERNEGTVGGNRVRLYWEQMLLAVDAIHQQNIIHSDLKPANFLMVSGELKLIDFGIAKRIANDTTNIHREHQTGTINYMAPEAISYTSERDIKIGRASDVWSLGCILYQMTYGHPPFAKSGKTMVMKLQSIVDKNHKIDFPPCDDVLRLDVIKGCLIRDPRKRLTIEELLEHPFIKVSQIMNPNGTLTSLGFGMLANATTGGSGPNGGSMYRSSLKGVLSQIGLHMIQNGTVVASGPGGANASNGDNLNNQASGDSHGQNATGSNGNNTEIIMMSQEPMAGRKLLNAAAQRNNQTAKGAHNSQNSGENNQSQKDGSGNLISGQSEPGIMTGDMTPEEIGEKAMFRYVEALVAQMVGLCKRRSRYIGMDGTVHEAGDDDGEIVLDIDPRAVTQCIVRQMEYEQPVDLSGFPALGTAPSGGSDTE